MAVAMYTHVCRGQCVNCRAEMVERKAFQLIFSPLKLSKIRVGVIYKILTSILGNEAGFHPPAVDESSDPSSSRTIRHLVV